MDFFEAVKKRRSVREYTTQSIAQEVLEKIVDAGRLAPTARGEEPWEFIAVIDRNMLEKLAGITDHGKFLESAAAAVVVACRDTKYYLEDGSAATENILLAATSLGIGSCWVAGDKKGYAVKVLELLGVPAGYKLVSIIALGYPQQPIAPPKKRPLKEVMHCEKF